MLSRLKPKLLEILISTENGQNIQLELNLQLTLILLTTEDYCDKLFLKDAQYLQKLMQLPIDYDVYKLEILDQLSRYRSRLSDVLQAVQANVNHGYLLQQSKNILSRDSQFQDTFTSFLNFLLSTQTGGQMLVAAGVISILVDSLKFENKKLAGRWLTMLDQTLFNFDCLPIFFGLKGVELLVVKIEQVVNEIIQFKNYDKKELLNGEFDLRLDENFRNLSSYLPLLRAILKLMLHLMQNSGGSDQMRNLIDTSLTKSLFQIFQHSFLFNHLNSYGLGKYY